MICVRNCDWLVTNVTKNVVLVTRIFRLSFCPLGIWNAKVKELFWNNIKLPCTIVVKQSINFTIAVFTQHHIVLAASPNTDIVGENMTLQKRDKSCQV